MNEKLRFGFIALFVVIFQSLIKIIGVIITQSLSFLSETVDTIVDIFFVALTLYSLYLSQKPADFEHMYGHEKIDSIGALFQGIVLMMIYGILIYNAIQTILYRQSSVENPIIGLQLLIISMVVNLVISLIIIWQGKKRRSLSLKMQGLNLFQDSLRAIIVLVNFLLVLFLNIFSLDPYFSILLSVIIIISALKLVKEGMDNLIDVNPLSAKLLKQLKEKIFRIPHVNGVSNIKPRISGNMLFLEINLAVEDHISVTQADDISKTIKSMINSFFHNYDVETIIEINPLSSEKSLGEKIINLIYSLRAEYPKILNITDLNVFQFKKRYVLYLLVKVDNSLSLKSAHEVVTEFELNLKKTIPLISRIISHIESEETEMKSLPEDIVCEKLEPHELEQLEFKLKKVLKSKSEIKGYHGFEFWEVFNFCIIELHVFFDGNLNISTIHNYTTELEKLIKENLQIRNLKQIIIHAEPLEGRTNGKIF
jgi:cation diffusion facilitator family transporter